MERKEIEKRLERFVKKGDFETASEFAENWGDFDLAIYYAKKGREFESKNKREIFYQGRSANKDLLKNIIYLNTSRPSENPQEFPYKNYHLLSKEELNLKKN